MIALPRFKRVHWLLLVVFTLAPTAVFAQQDSTSQGQNQQGQDRPQVAQPKIEAAQVKTEEAQGQTEEAQAKTENDKVISGMSILGNQDAPKSLVIVPWKSSEIGDSIGISPMLDDSRLPIDKEVFMRMLSYYEIRSETAHLGDALTKGNAAQPNTAAQRGKQ
jgi:hypothetical protein